MCSYYVPRVPLVFSIITDAGMFSGCLFVSLFVVVFFCFFFGGVGMCVCVGQNLLQR